MLNWKSNNGAEEFLQGPAEVLDLNDQFIQLVWCNATSEINNMLVSSTLQQT